MVPVDDLLFHEPVAADAEDQTGVACAWRPSRLFKRNGMAFDARRGARAQGTSKVIHLRSKLGVDEGLGVRGLAR